MKINTLYYLKNLITDIHVASITPTSRFGVEKVLEKIDFPEDQADPRIRAGYREFHYHTSEKHGRQFKIDRHREERGFLQGAAQEHP